VGQGCFLYKKKKKNGRERWRPGYLTLGWLGGDFGGMVADDYSDFGVALVLQRREERGGWKGKNKKQEK
jgi:hypothetical protein